MKASTGSTPYAKNQASKTTGEGGLFHPPVPLFPFAALVFNAQKRKVHPFPLILQCHAMVLSNFVRNFGLR